MCQWTPIMPLAAESVPHRGIATYCGVCSHGHSLPVTCDHSALSISA
uniref:Uncharacterized protein n=1 Tax=Anguilla anguilla TaxID=7936 RepID=A0A0E9TVA1_ANGAN